MTPGSLQGPLSRLVLGTFAAAVLIVAGVGAAIYNEHEHSAQQSASAMVQAQVLAQTVTAALSFGDRTALQQYVQAWRASPDIEAIGVYDQDGALVARYGAAALPGRLDVPAGAAAAHGRMTVVVPVREKAERLGQVYLRTRAEPVGRRLARYLGPGLLLLMASIMFILMALDARTLARTNLELRTQIAERERAEAALRQAQKMEAIGRLTGGIAHDFNNMLAVVIGSLDLVIRRLSEADPKLLRMAQAASDGAKRAANLTQRLLAFSRQQPLNPAAVDISSSILETAELIRRTVGENIEVETTCAAGLWRAHIDRSQLDAAILNLAINARDAMPDGGKLTLALANTYLDATFGTGDEGVTPGPYVLISVADTGAGIAPELLPQVFEPFFTTKALGVGTGLGLSQVLGFIRQSGGQVRLESRVGAGTTVKLFLPKSLQAEDARPEPPPSIPLVRRDVTVLLVEDEAGVREFVREALEELGYHVVTAERPGQALQLLSKRPEISVLLTDVIMPEMNGKALADAALAMKPGLPVLFMTGYAQDAIVHNGVLDAQTHLLSKPFTVAQLGMELEAVMKAPVLPA